MATLIPVRGGSSPSVWRPMLIGSAGIVVVLGLIVGGGRWGYHRWLFYHKIPGVLDNYHLGSEGQDPEPGITALGGPKQAAKRLRKWIDETPPYITGSAQAYFLLSECNENVLPKLISMLGSTDECQRMCATEALCLIGPRGSPAIPALIDVLKDHATDRRTEFASRLDAVVASTLGRMGPAAAPAVPQLCKLLDDESKGVRYSASKALGQIGPAASEAVPRLIKLLEDKELDLRETIVDALGDIGPSAKEAVPELCKMLKSADASVRYGAELALRKIDPSALNSSVEK